MNSMAKINGTELAYSVRGEGEPVLLMHCGFVADGFAPLLNQTVLTERYQLIAYQQPGFFRGALFYHIYHIYSVTKYLELNTNTLEITHEFFIDLFKMLGRNINRMGIQV